MPVKRRGIVYHLVPDWCMLGVECSGVYRMPTPWLYLYYAHWTTDAGVERQLTYDQTAQRQFIFFVIPVIIGVARRGLWTGDLHDGRLRIEGRDLADLSRPLIGQLSPIFMFALDVSTGLIGMWRMVTRM